MFDPFSNFGIISREQKEHIICVTGEQNIFLKKEVIEVCICEFVLENLQFASKTAHY